MTVEKRMTKSISKQTTTAGKPFEFYLSWEGTEVVDFKGNVFPSKAAMCRAYGISVSTYTNRRKAGWTQEKALTKRGNPYSRLELCDGDVKVDAKSWDSPEKFETQGICVGAVISGTVACQDYRGDKSFFLQEYALGADGVTVEDFVLHAPVDPQQMYQSILKNVAGTVLSDADRRLMQNGQLSEDELKEKIRGTLAELVFIIYENNKDRLLYWSAAKDMHHSMLGGLLYHTYRMVQAAFQLAKVYTNLDAEVLLAAAALHDIGKLEEMETDQMGIATFTADGNLFGHLLLGVQMVEEEAAEGSYDPEKLRCLEHCIATHHGNREWGAIALPATKEAEALFVIDYLDRRMERYEEQTKILDPGRISDMKDFMYGAYLYKPLSGGRNSGES